MDIFQYFFSDKMLAVMTKNTNKYAKLNHPNPNGWKEVLEAEVRIYIALLIYMGYTGSQPIKEYWDAGGISKSIHPISHYMSRLRFYQVLCPKIGFTFQIVLPFF